MNKYYQKQIKYCEDNKLPVMSAERCFNCNKDIYEDEVTKKKADKEMITACPFCRYSFVD